MVFLPTKQRLTHMGSIEFRVLELRVKGFKVFVWVLGCKVRALGCRVTFRVYHLVFAGMHWRSVARAPGLRIKQTIVSGDGWSFRKKNLLGLRMSRQVELLPKNRHQKNATNFTNKQERKQKTTQRSV